MVGSSALTIDATKYTQNKMNMKKTHAKNPCHHGCAWIHADSPPPRRSLPEPRWDMGQLRKGPAWSVREPTCLMTHMKANRARMACFA